jgi:CheY-specific phosphatase CheX
MKIKIKSKWNFISMVRLTAGIAGTVQGFVIKEFALSLAGFFLVYMAVAGRKNLNVELKEVTSTSKEIEHEKVDARL